MDLERTAAWRPDGGPRGPGLSPRTPWGPPHHKSSTRALPAAPERRADSDSLELLVERRSEPQGLTSLPRAHALVRPFLERRYLTDDRLRLHHSKKLPVSTLKLTNHIYSHHALNKLAT